MKYFIVIGGGVEQAPMYKELIKKNINPICVDFNSNCYCKKYAKIFINESTRDPKKIIIALKKLKKIYIGVSTLGTDTPYTVSKVAKYFKLNAISITSSLNASLKHRMKNCFKNKKINTPAYFISNNLSDTEKFIKRIGYPLIIKPIDGRGSEGVFLVSEKDELKKLYNLSKKNSLYRQVLLEKFLFGKQYSSEGFFENERFYLSGVALRYYDNLKKTMPNIIEAGGFMPAKLSEKKMNEIERIMERAGKSLGISKGPFKADLVFFNNQFYVIEVAARLSGNYLSSHYIRWIHRINLVNINLNFAMNKKNNIDSLLRKKTNKYISIRYFFPAQGVLKKVKFPSNLKNKYQTFFDKKVLLKKGTVIPKYITHRDRIGLIRCIGKSSKKVYNESLKIVKTIKFEYDK